MLHSHPDKLLKKHIDEVSEAAEKIWSTHSNRLSAQLDIHLLVQRAVAFHDVGKASKHFQKYIQAPKAWRGDKRRKAHTPFSMVAALTESMSNGWSWKDALAVAVVASGHHSRFKTADELSGGMRDGVWQNILEDQSNSIDWLALNDATGQSIQPFVASTDHLDLLADWFEDQVLERGLKALTVTDGVAFRLQCQLIHSILLEADKAYLKLDEADRDTYRSGIGQAFDMQRLEHFIDGKESSPLDGLRTMARNALASGTAAQSNSSIFTMTLPTGSGKTLLAATWALDQRGKLSTTQHTPPVIVVLPFLSIVSQTETEYRDFLPPELSILPYHSLSIRDRDDTEPPEKSEAAEFMLDIWDADVIITTFDQFLLALLSPKARHQMRFHSLCDAVVVMDEVQALPTALWDIVHQCLAQLGTLGNMRLLAMSATQPGFLPTATEIIKKPESFFATLSRYELVARHEVNIFLEDFVAEVLERAKEWRDRRVLLVFNTRRSARTVRDALSKAGYTTVFLSADVTPRDRLASIKQIKLRLPCIVVATQCIEAGVDIDMDLVIRDFAPLDSLVQVAGRCNRHALRPTERVEIVCLTDNQERPFCQFIYDKILLQETHAVLYRYLSEREVSAIPERDVFELTRDFYSGVRSKKDSGLRLTKAFAEWTELPDIHQLLRGKDGMQQSFVVIEQDPELSKELARIAAIEDRWDRRRQLRSVSGRLASISVSIFVRGDFNPERYANLDATGNFWLLKSGYYDSQRGVDLDPSENADERPVDWGMLF